MDTPARPSDPVPEWLLQDATRKRCADCGIGPEDVQVASFIHGAEFISLGCFCGVALGLQALGLKRLGYPFDLVRCPLDGVVQLLDTDFEDFLTFTGRDASCFRQARWGGSFWHQDPETPAAREDCVARIERLLALPGSGAPGQQAT